MTIQSNFPTIKPSLLLDFANTKILDPKVTFTRASTARVYDGKTVAKAEENLLLRSQEFDNASWSKFNSTVTANSVAAPDGTTTAETLRANSATSGHNTSQSATLVSGTTYTASVFAKKDTIDYVSVALINGSSASTFIGAAFNLNTGVVSSSNANGTGFSVTSTSITDVGNGWYRCVLTGVFGSLGASPLMIVALNDDGTTPNNQSGGKSFTGTSTESIYLWGAQLEQRDAVTAYTPTTTQPITNYIPVLQTAAAGVARFDHNPVTGESLGLLIEEQRTNLFQRSEEFDNAYWTKTPTIVANTTIAPDGTLSADTIVPTTASAIQLMSREVAVAAGATTVTIYAKSAGYNFLQIYDSAGSNFANFDLASGVLGSSSGATASITSVGNGWYRCAFTEPSLSAANYAFRFSVIPASNSARAATLTGDGYSGIYIWGAQLE
jgi:hypothetical protein